MRLFHSRPLLFLWLLVVTAAAGAADTPQDPPREAKHTVARSDAVDALHRFQQDPLNNWEAAKIFMTFVKEDGDIHVSMPEELVPWMRDPNCPPWARALLLSAFVAGNFDAQLEDNSKLDDTEAGLTYTVEVYEIMKQKHPDLDVAMLEKLVAAKQDNHLQSAVETMIRKTQPTYEQ